MSYKKLTIVSVLSIFLVGCTMFQTKPTAPPKYQWGKAGTQPTAVWQTYDWVIVADKGE